MRLKIVRAGDPGLRAEARRLTQTCVSSHKRTRERMQHQFLVRTEMRVAAELRRTVEEAYLQVHRENALGNIPFQQSLKQA